MDDIYKVGEIELTSNQPTNQIGKITEKDKLIAAKQILFGIAVLYMLTLLVYVFNPVGADKLLNICTTIFPPLVTLILVSYFRENR